LTSDDFKELAAKPKLKWMAPMQAEREVKKGRAVWVDVRPGTAYAEGSLVRAISVPMPQLREVMEKKDRTKTYVFFCDDSRTSAAAAYIVDLMGFETAVLRGGLDAMRKNREAGYMQRTFRMVDPTAALSAEDGNAVIDEIDSEELDSTPPETVNTVEAQFLRNTERGEATDVDVTKIWQKLVRRSKSLTGLAEDTLAELAGHLEPVRAEKGQVVMQQNDAADSCYLIVRGKAEVTRRETADARPRRLATLKKGDAFGEEALLSGRPRNATVTMTARGLLMRLSGKDFTTLFEEPKLIWCSAMQAQEAVTENEAVWLDVRTPAEFAKGSLADALSIPLDDLRVAGRKLNRKKIYICVCETSRLSANAAFLLEQMGYRAGVLRGGYQRLRDMLKKGLATTAFKFTGDGLDVST